MRDPGPPRKPQTRGRAASPHAHHGTAPGGCQRERWCSGTCRGQPCSSAGFFRARGLPSPTPTATRGWRRGVGGASVAMVTRSSSALWRLEPPQTAKPRAAAWWDPTREPRAHHVLFPYAHRRHTHMHTKTRSVHAPNAYTPPRVAHGART